MSATQDFAILSLPQLPGTSGNPVILSQRFALRDASGNLVGYSEATTLQNWSALKKIGVKSCLLPPRSMHTSHVSPSVMHDDVLPA